MKKKLMSLYNRTRNNCHYYYEQNDPKLYAEIGCLRGIAYCLEEAGIDPFTLPDLVFFIDISNEYYEGSRA